VGGDKKLNIFANDREEGQKPLYLSALGFVSKLF
jgi:hypothetical protein